MNTRVLAFDEVLLPYAFRFPETHRYFSSYLLESPHVELQNPVSVLQEDYDDWAAAGNKNDSFAEFCLLCQQTSQRLFAYQRCVFHAAAILWRGKAWLIAGGSGVGKSTQCRTLMELWPSEFAVINGDKPILACKDDGSVMVHPSPWNGKEGLHGAGAAPLAGLFLLRRGDSNAIQTLTPKAAAPLAFSCVFQDYRSPEIIRRAAAITQRILTSCPSWLVTSHEVPHSTKLIHQTMLEVDINGI